MFTGRAFMHLPLDQNLACRTLGKSQDSVLVYITYEIRYVNMLKSKYSPDRRFPGSYKLDISQGVTHSISRGKKNMNEKPLGSGLEDLVDIRKRTVSHRNYKWTLFY